VASILPKLVAEILCPVSGLKEDAMRNRTRQAGFTAVELMISVVLIGLVLAASLPGFHQLMKSNNLAEGGREFAGHIRLARQMAVAEGIPYIVTWNDEAGSYTIVRDEDQDGVVDEGEPSQGPFLMPNGITLANAGNGGFSADQVSLNPNGTASESGSLRLAKDRGELLRLTLLGPTAQVEITKGQADEQQITTM
jgi:prepilin-type N-terminal cleavage/methylation domain-containing protein